ncbi:hypothetical protein [Marinospirillum insulare]|uniref:Uncharacterized protein n=1 Tax=Marinospirillum insulare TaxID=217169 RepID=A0ABQ5ZVE4_9GAMM|nr:hypothetical protein [Marinospirillum insulare]GLR63979.1 hypothetical protein GCM10007878_14170 [Marinospirillum insulare]
MNVSMSLSSQVHSAAAYSASASKKPQEAIFSTDKKLEIGLEDIEDSAAKTKIDLRNASMNDLKELSKNVDFPDGFYFPLIIAPYYPIANEDYMNHKVDYLAHLESGAARSNKSAKWFEDTLTALMPYHSPDASPAQAVSLNPTARPWTDDQVVEQQRLAFLLKTV